jgi:hypothetical protein
VFAVDPGDDLVVARIQKDPHGCVEWAKPIRWAEVRCFDCLGRMREAARALNVALELAVAYLRALAEKEIAA